MYRRCLESMSSCRTSASRARYLYRPRRPPRWHSAVVNHHVAVSVAGALLGFPYAWLPTASVPRAEEPHPVRHREIAGLEVRLRLVGLDAGRSGVCRPPEDCPDAAERRRGRASSQLRASPSGSERRKSLGMGRHVNGTSRTVRECRGFSLRGASSRYSRRAARSRSRRTTSGPRPR